MNLWVNNTGGLGVGGAHCPSWVCLHDSCVYCSQNKPMTREGKVILCPLKTKGSGVNTSMKSFLFRSYLLTHTHTHTCEVSIKAQTVRVSRKGRLKCYTEKLAAERFSSLSTLSLHRCCSSEGVLLEKTIKDTIVEMISASDAPPTCCAPPLSPCDAPH